MENENKAKYGHAICNYKYCEIKFEKKTKRHIYCRPNHKKEQWIIDNKVREIETLETDLKSLEKDVKIIKEKLSIESK